MPCQLDGQQTCKSFAKLSQQWVIVTKTTWYEERQDNFQRSLITIDIDFHVISIFLMFCQRGEPSVPFTRITAAFDSQAMARAPRHQAILDDRAWVGLLL